MELKKRRLNKWAILTVILGVMLIFSLFTRGLDFEGVTGRSISEVEAQEKVDDFLQNYLLDPRIEVSIVNVEEQSGMYKISISVSTVLEDGTSQTTDEISYMTKDGEIFFFSGIVIDELPTPEEIEQLQSQTAPIN